MSILQKSLNMSPEIRKTLFGAGIIAPEEFLKNIKNIPDDELNIIVNDPKFVWCINFEGSVSSNNFNLYMKAIEKWIKYLT